MIWPAGLDVRGFLEDYWQKRPLLLPGALPQFGAVIDGDELAGLACDAELESRIVQRDAGDHWSLRTGPFDESDFAALPERDWTLLVQDVDKHVPEVAAVLEHFEFLPDWRLDDVMISYAAPGGSVGPHVDAYDVFLLQAVGRRSWTLDPAPSDLSLRPRVPLKLLRRFTPVERFDLAPGDLLYLPPGVAHHGVGEAPSITWSVGFRAPSAADLLRELAAMMEEAMPASRYTDPDLDPQEVRPGQLSGAAIGRARALLEVAQEMIDTDRAAAALGRAATRAKPWLVPEPADQPLAADSLLARLSAGARLRRHPDARVLWSERTDGIWLFADGECWALPGGLARIAACAAGTAPFGATEIAAATDPSAAADVLAALHARGSIELCGPDPECSAK
jgi:50S ribosomal protein L16 3-hydroxylase